MRKKPYNNVESSLSFPFFEAKPSSELPKQSGQSGRSTERRPSFIPWEQARKEWLAKNEQLVEEIEHCKQCDLMTVCPAHRKQQERLAKEAEERKFPPHF